MNFDDFIKKTGTQELLRFTTIGSVDDGKSTLIGRLLSDCKMVYQDHMDSLEKDSKKWGTQGDKLEFSLLLDGLKAEREQGITIDVAYRYFSTPKRKFIIADNPGHIQYTRNMATGASTSNLAVILIDALKGVTTQSKRHCFIASLLGIRHLVIAVNKMDLAGWSEDVFGNIKDNFTEFTAKLDLYDVRFIPVSALSGDNIVDKSVNMPWYSGDTLLNCLETVHIASDINLIDLRFPVQYVIRPNQDFRGFSGTIASGILRKGDEIAVLPSGLKSKVKSIVTYDGELEEAFAPMAVTIVLEDEIDISRGDMLVHVKNLPAVNDSFEAIIVWMSDTPLETGKSYLFKHTTNLVQGSISELRYIFDVDKLHRKQSDILGINDIGRVKINLSRPIFTDDYSKNRATGSFIIIDRLTNATMGAGMINERHHTLPFAGTYAKKEEQSVNIVSGKVIRSEREKKYKQKPAIIFVTGYESQQSLHSSRLLERILFDNGYLAYLVETEENTEGESYSETIHGEMITPAIKALYSAGLLVIVPLSKSEDSFVNKQNMEFFDVLIGNENGEYSINIYSPDGNPLYTAILETTGENDTETANIIAENIFSALIALKIIW